MTGCGTCSGDWGWYFPCSFSVPAILTMGRNPQFLHAAPPMLLPWCMFALWLIGLKPKRKVPRLEVYHLCSIQYTSLHRDLWMPAPSLLVVGGDGGVAVNMWHHRLCSGYKECWHPWCVLPPVYSTSVLQSIPWSYPKYLLDSCEGSQHSGSVDKEHVPESM